MNKLRLFIKKLNDKNGFSLTETLTTLIIMSMVGIMVTSGITTSSRVYKEITEYTNAQLMLSNTITAIQDELIYAIPDSISTKDSGETNDEISFKHVKNGVKTLKYVGEGNKGICISYGEGSSTFYPLVSYQNKTSLYNTWTVNDKGNGIIEISVSVCKPDGTELVKVENYDIKMLNG